VARALGGEILIFQLVKAAVREVENQLWMILWRASTAQSFLGEIAIVVSGGKSTVEILLLQTYT
jgi:hypothetical protein